MRLARLACVLMVLLVAACAGASEDTRDRLTGSAWQATELNGKPVSTPSPVTLAFENGRGSGRSGCNQYSGTVSVGDGTLRFAEIMSTKMACMEEGAMLTESVYLQVLSGAETWSLAPDGSLTITGSKGTASFRPLMAPTAP